MPSSLPKLSVMIDKYLNFMVFIKSASPQTLRAYRLDLTQAFGTPPAPPPTGEDELLRICRESLSRWASLSLASRNRKSATLKSFLGWLYDEKITERDLSTQIICPKVPKKLPHFLSVDEILAVLESFHQEEQHSPRLWQDKALFLVLYGGGLRVSEACNLRWTDVNFTTRSLRILGKGKKERLVILPQLAMQALQTLKGHKVSENFVFGLTAMNPRVAYEMVRVRGAKAQLMKSLHPHALRHSFATHMLSSGANLRTLQEMLGHESLQATEKYTHLGVDQLARTLEAHHPLSGGGKRRGR